MPGEDNGGVRRILVGLTLGPCAAQLDVCLWLCALRVGVDAAMTTSGITALMAAAQRDHAQVVAALVDAGAALELTSSDARTALAIAAQYNAVESVSELLKRGANPNGACCSPAAAVAAAGSLEHDGAPEDPAAARATPARQLHRLTEARGGRAAGVGGDVDDPGVPELPMAATGVALADPLQPNATSLSSTAPPPPVSGSSVQSGSCIAPSADAPAADSASPMVLAARRGHVEVLRALARGGADVNPRLADGRPLLLAAIDGFSTAPGAVPARVGRRYIVRPEVVAALLALGANPLEGVAEAADAEVGSASTRRFRSPATELSGTADRGLQRVWAEHGASRGILYASEQRPLEGTAAET